MPAAKNIDCEASRCAYAAALREVQVIIIIISLDFSPRVNISRRGRRGRTRADAALFITGRAYVGRRRCSLIEMQIIAVARDRRVHLLDTIAVDFFSPRNGQIAAVTVSR